MKSTVTIHLCGLPEGCHCWRADHSFPLHGLASSGVYLATRVASHAGALLPHRFTLTCDRFRSIGGLLSVALFRQVAPTWLAPALCPVKSRLSSSCTVETAHDAITRITHRL